MSVAAERAITPSHHYWLRIGLMTVAALELMDSFASASGIFSARNDTAGLLQLAHSLFIVKLALAPVAAAAGLVFAAMGRLRRAVLSLAAFALMGWATSGSG